MANYITMTLCDHRTGHHSAAGNFLVLPVSGHRDRAGLWRRHRRSATAVLSLATAARHSVCRRK